MSADLIAFLKAWYDWATSGAPDWGMFCRATGLCYNAIKWDTHKRTSVYAELTAIFGEDEYPFGSNYIERSVARTQHECPKRLAWVRARLVEAGEIA